MRRFLILAFAAVFLLPAQSAYATWSVIALDRATGTVVIASATCVAQQAFAGFPAKDLRDVQAIVVPGKGVAAAQALSDRVMAAMEATDSDITPQEDANPVKTLRMRYDRWKKRP